MKFETKDSGNRHEFSTGSVRDTAKGKERYDLIPTTSLKRLAALYQRGADKYGEFNWAKGQPYSRLYASTFRHLMQWAEGETDEDHAAAVEWNMMAVLHFDETGRTDLDDMEKYEKANNKKRKAKS
jgi:hypothetical protein